MNNLKEKLLSLGIFIDNEFLDSYCLLIEANENTNKVSRLTERHHIIQRAYYTRNNLKIDNTSENLVNLTHFDHCLAHYYLCLCTNATYAYINQYAFIKMVKITTRFDDFDFNNFLQSANKYNEIYKSFCENQAASSKKVCEERGGGSIKGKHCFTDGTKKIYAEVCPDGFWPSSANGGYKASEETRQKLRDAAQKRAESIEYRKKLSEACKGRPGNAAGKHWITDGITEKYVDLQINEIPDNWRLGRSNKSAEKNRHHKTTNGLKLISNGQEQRYIDLSTEQIPEGWYLGGSDKYKEQSRNARKIGREKYKEKREKEKYNNENQKTE